MAFGRHLEWRGFGEDPEVFDRVRRLRPLYPDEHRVTDRYLWTPGCPLNVKLREGRFKLKRLVGRVGDYDEWLEDEDENYPYPVPWRVVEEVAGALGVAPAGDASGEVRDEAALLAALPVVRVIAVAKRRQQYGIDAVPGAIIELASISVPEDVRSVSVEADEPEAIDAVKERLGLPGDLRELDYLAALEVWGRGERLGAPS